MSVPGCISGNYDQSCVELLPQKGHQGGMALRYHHSTVDSDEDIAISQAGLSRNSTLSNSIDVGVTKRIETPVDVLMFYYD